ncbi:MAG: hypothetical protein B7X60_00055 [Polynucleobacter sp. 39-45-136]|jgi:hypothetical protein|nr:MAG: hypothetical protein B7X60_00055 [Polynucleobacter sp. 39-45-136]
MSVDTVVITSQPAQAPEGHDQAMIDLVDKSSAPPAEEPLATGDDSQDRPQWLPEKFKSPEDMAKAYAELESKLGAPKVTDSEPTPDPSVATPDDAQNALSQKGLDLTEFSKEFSDKGELSPESYEKLSKSGFDKALVDQYIQGQRALADGYANSIKSEAGGDEKYSEIVQWAKVNMTPSEIDAFNKAVDSGNQDQARLAVKGLKATFEKSNGREPNLLSGGVKGGSEGDTFESTAQLTKAMADPRYREDPAYRAKVQSKLGRSSLF